MARAARTKSGMEQATFLFDLGEVSKPAEAAPRAPESRAPHIRAPRRSPSAQAAAEAPSPTAMPVPPRMDAHPEAPSTNGKSAPKTQGKRTSGSRSTPHPTALPPEVAAVPNNGSKKRRTTVGSLAARAGHETDDPTAAPFTRSKEEHGQQPTPSPAKARGRRVQQASPELEPKSSTKARRARVEQPDVVPPTPPARSSARRRAKQVESATTDATAGTKLVDMPVSAAVVAAAPPAPRRRQRTETEAPQPQAPKQPAPVEKASGAANAIAEPSPTVPTSASPSHREMVVGPAFLMCYDDRAKATIEQKIVEALAAYEARFQRAANLVLVNAGVASEVQVEHIAIERRPSVPPNNFWVGQQPAVVAPQDS